MQRILIDQFGGQGLPPDEVAFFAQRVAVFLTSSDERRYGQWEHTSWWDFVPGRATLPGCNHRPC